MQQIGFEAVPCLGTNFMLLFYCFCHRLQSPFIVWIPNRKIARLVFYCLFEHAAGGGDERTSECVIISVSRRVWPTQVSSNVKNA